MGLQFLWIEANLLRFFLVEVRNSRGKFDEIKEEFVINPAPIASQSSLNAGGSRWTRDFPQNSLNSLHESIKSWENKKGEYMLLKGILARFLGPFDPVVGACWWSKSSASVAHQSAAIVATISLQMCHDRGSIAPRSWNSSTKPPRRPIARLDELDGSDLHDQGPLPSAARWRSGDRDGSTCVTKIEEHRSVSRHLSNGDVTLQKAPRVARWEEGVSTVSPRHD